MKLHLAFRRPHSASAVLKASASAVLEASAGAVGTASAAFDASAEKARVSESLVRSASNLLGRRNDRDMIHGVCEALTFATPHVRLAWTWFGPADTASIRPQVVAGPSAEFARSLVIDRNLLTEMGPAFRTLAGKKVEPFNVSQRSLFGPWREAAGQHGIRNTLALPLASTVNADRGLLVLYANVPDYFEQVGVGLFEALADMFSAVLSAAAEHAQLREAAYSDALTGLMNRRAVELVSRPILRLDAIDAPAAMLLIDIDHFKRLNDAHGHAAGDTVLQSVAQLLLRTLRKGDSVMRWGGEEFLVCLPGADITSAQIVARKMLEAFAQTTHAVHGSAAINLTVSIGVAELAVGEPFASTVGRADAALYDAKHQGRNQACTAAQAVQTALPTDRCEQRLRAV